MKIVIIIIISHSYVYYSHKYHLWTKHSFFVNLKLFKISGLQTKMVFKQRFKYFKNEKINFIIVILNYKVCYIRIYIFYFILLYTRRAISTQTNPKSVLKEKKTYQMMTLQIQIWSNLLIGCKDESGDHKALLILILISSGVVGSLFAGIALDCSKKYK